MAKLDIAALQLVQRAFDAAVDAPVEARADLIRALCSHDLALEQRVHDLLAADDSAATLPRAGALSRAVADEASTDGRPVTLTAETRLGAYRVVEVLSSTEALAHFETESRAQGRIVHLELVLHGGDPEPAIRHFQHVRRRLDGLRASAIAKPLDAFEPGPSRVCFVTEHVDGIALLDYCHRVSLDDALTAYRQVCNAVRHAHGRGIVHGHLGYSRILVTGEGPPPSVVIRGFGRGPAADASVPSPGPTADARALGALLTEVCGKHLGGSIATARERGDHALLRTLRNLALDPGTGTATGQRLADELHGLARRSLADTTTSGLAAAVTYLLDSRSLLRDSDSAASERLEAVEQDLDAARMRGRSQGRRPPR